ncbi:MAG TPA: M17 family peptidase N-terminal domain-containing protein, partial [Gaiellaceae bacterium]|nr:M17 family peptidase N-terminal domain-containing protein [Gaiellaceae bacterium]
MRVEVQAVAPEQVEADVVAVPLAPGDGLAGAAATLDTSLGGLLGRLAGEGELQRDAGRTALVHVDGKLGAARVAVAGVGDAGDADSLRTAAAAVARQTSGFAGTLAWAIDDSLPLPAEEQARAIVEGTELGAYQTARWKRDEPTPKLARLVLCGTGDGLERAAARAATVAAWTNRAR